MDIQRFDSSKLSSSEFSPSRSCTESKQNNELEKKIDVRIKSNSGFSKFTSSLTQRLNIKQKTNNIDLRGKSQSLDKEISSDEDPCSTTTTSVSSSSVADFDPCTVHCLEDVTHDIEERQILETQSSAEYTIQPLYEPRTLTEPSESIPKQGVRYDVESIKRKSEKETSKLKSYKGKSVSFDSIMTQISNTENKYCKRKSTLPKTLELTKTSPKFQLDDKKEQHFKILVFGEKGVGKTTIINYLSHGQSNSTVGSDIKVKILNWDERRIINVQFLEMSGDYNFEALCPMINNEISGMLMVFDRVQICSLKQIMQWKNELDSEVLLKTGNYLPCVLIANKCDEMEGSTVASEHLKIEEFCLTHGFTAWFETSVKQKYNIENALNCLVIKMLLNSV